jgi:hypothetical protein
MQSTPRAWLVIGLAAMAASIAVSLRLGQDVSWDLRNYHFYDGWALVNGFNPVLPTLAYLLIANLPPWAAATVLAALQSVNLVLLAAIAGQVFPRCSTARPGGARMPWIVAAVLIGGTGPMMLTELGGTFGDNITSIFVLGAFAALGRCRRGAGLLRAWPPASSPSTPSISSA